MPTRDAACSCGQLRLAAEGDPIRISMCHCLACQRQTGSAFGIQARFPSDRVRVVGRYSDYVRTSDEGDKDLIKRSIDFALPIWKSGQIFQARHQVQGIWTRAGLGNAPMGALQAADRGCCLPRAEASPRSSAASSYGW